MPTSFKSTIILILLAASLLSAGQYVISTYAGGALPITPASAVSTSIGLPGGIAVDTADNVFFSGRNCLFRLDATGVLTRVAGNTRAGYSGDGGPAINAQLTSPNSLAADNSGNLYFSDNYRIRKISAGGIITTVAGNGKPGYYGDGGPALAAQIDAPDAIAVDGAGNIYLTDYFYGVRRVSAAGIITTVAGNGTQGFSGDGGLATSAQLNGTEGVAVDRNGNIYIADSSNYRVRRVSVTGIITTFAGNGVDGYSGDGGPATNAGIDRPDAIAFDRNGNLYIAASYNFRVRRVSPTGGIATAYAGDASPGAEGVAIGFGVDSTGNMYLSDVSKYRIRQISPDGAVSTAAGDGVFSFSGDGGPAIDAQLFGPQAIVTDTAGNLYIADSYNSRIRRVSSDGIITTIAGNGTYGYAGDGGPAIQAEFLDPWALALDSGGNLYIADAVNNRIRRISPDGIIITIAGGDQAGYSGDGGPAIAALLNAPAALAVDSAGNVYIADSVNQCIRKVSTAGIITTVAINAQLRDPAGITVDSAGNLYIVDNTGYGRVSKVSPQGILTALTGPNDIGGPPRTEQTIYPNAVVIDGAGNVYFTDSYNYRVRRISPDGTIATITGNGSPGYSGDDGPAILAQLYNPVSLALDNTGRVYIADSLDSAIRLLEPIASSVTINAVTNGASNRAGPVSPGEIVVLYGSMLGPVSPASSSQTDGAGTIDTTELAGTSVSFNGTPAPIVYTSFTQVAAIVPYGLAGTTAEVSLTSQGLTSAPRSVAVAPAAPGLFTLDSTGQGQAAAINQDGSINSGVYPAPKGSLVSLFATGVGRNLPAAIGRKILKEPLPRTLRPVTVTIGGHLLTPGYAEGVAGEEGVMQIKVSIPFDMLPGTAVPVAISVGGITSQNGVTLAIGSN